ncbi:pyridoxal phosphate-dependent aminotransferase [Streptomyces sp. BI20]|uniref:pyridoxal phosphate-dependent aminotransferase n=1 Tax=Streptomyces sp. BI20 TaxID=3403460 RepID=UPI003C795AE9
MVEGAPEGHGPVRYGPPAPEAGLPALPALVEILADAARTRITPEPPGGGLALRTAAAGYFERRGLSTTADRIAVGPGAPALLLALLGATSGEVLVPRPSPAWWAPQIRMLGRRVHHVATPAECGGIPDPFALLETVRRIRDEGGRPRVLVLSPADDPTATVAPPEALRETCEAAADADLFVISDETWRDTLFGPHRLTVSPASLVPERTVVLVGLGGAVMPAGWPVAVARFPAGSARARTLDVLTAMGHGPAGPVAEVAAFALDDPPEVRRRAVDAARLYGVLGGAAHRLLTRAGALARPPRCGRHLYADLGPFRATLARRGVTDAMELEDWLGDRLGVPTPGGHRFGDDLGALRVRLSTGLLLGADPGGRARALGAPDPLDLPAVGAGLGAWSEVLDDLRRDGR